MDVVRKAPSSEEKFSGSPDGFKILVANDNETIQVLLPKIFENNGFEILMAETGRHLQFRPRPKRRGIGLGNEAATGSTKHWGDMKIVKRYANFAG